MDNISLIIKKEFNLTDVQTENTIALMDEGNTIPFIARYRKEKTGSLDDQVLREIYDRLTYLRNLEEKRKETIRLIEEQGQLTDEIEKSIKEAKTLTEIEDIYRPFRPKRRTRATIAKEKGLEPLSEMIMGQKVTLEELFKEVEKFVDDEKGVESIEEALSGAKDIIAEKISDDADIRKHIREITIKTGVIVSKAAKEEDGVYSQYYDYSEPVAKIANHRLLAINRGEKEDFLKVSIEADNEKILSFTEGRIITNEKSEMRAFIKEAAEDSIKRLIMPSIENEVRAYLTDIASDAAIKLFGINLHNLLLQPPIRGKVVLGLDPAYRTGCKIAVVDATGKVLDTTVIFCTMEHHDKEKAKEIILKMIEKHKVDIIAIGNGTATKESEIFIADVVKEAPHKTVYAIVNESGASVYSASKLGAEEFPDFDVTQRSAVSIARRLQDPLAELVKIEPKSIGVGQYQHDMNQKRLSEALGGVVEDCVNSVGVDLNTASAPLLSYIAGINATVAKNIVKYREENGSFKNRKQLLKVPKLGNKAYEQCAGFLRIPGGENPLDNTSVHPESYEQTKQFVQKIGFSLDDISLKGEAMKEAMKRADLSVISKEIGLGIPTLKDAIEAISKPGRDPREDLTPPVLKGELLSIENLSVGMVLKGTVRNVIDFGAFLDIGVHQDGLVHISQISDKYIKHPMEVLSVGDVVDVKIIALDVAKNRISLSIKEAKER